MDLKEAGKDDVTRHPWETTRLHALRGILAPRMFEGMRILDIGCGDGFVAGNLFSSVKDRDITAVDTNLSDESLAKFTAAGSGIAFQRELPREGAFDVVLLLDVLEHVEDDRSLLKGVVERYLKADGVVMITVPAFNSIYSEHDAFLGHYRRYNLQELVQLASVSGLDTRRSGYLFSSLLLPKLVLYRMLKTAACSEGVGNWQGGRFITRVVELMLKLDNAFLMAAGRLGVKIPGLTGWVLCEKHG